MSADTVDDNETKATKRGLLIASGYALAAFLTFGHIFNQNYVDRNYQDCSKFAEYETNWLACTNNNISVRHGRTDTLDAFPPAFAAGIAWPLYWAGHFAIKVTK